MICPYVYLVLALKYMLMIQQCQQMVHVVNIIPFLKLISVIAENSVRKDWVAVVKGFPAKLTAVINEAPIYVKW